MKRPGLNEIQATTPSPLATLNLSWPLVASTDAFSFEQYGWQKNIVVSSSPVGDQAYSSP